jgi:hypothetical protein
VIVIIQIGVLLRDTYQQVLQYLVCIISYATHCYINKCENKCEYMLYQQVKVHVLFLIFLKTCPVCVIIGMFTVYILRKYY